MLAAMLEEPARTWELSSLLDACGWTDQAHIAGAGGTLDEKGLVVIEENRTTCWSLGSEGEGAIDSGLIEQRIWDWLSDAGDSAGMKELQASGIVEKHEAGIGVGLMKDLGISLEKGSFVIPEASGAIEATLEMRRDFLAKIAKGGEQGIPDSSLEETMITSFSKRKGLIVSSERVTRRWRLSEEGAKVSPSELSEKLVVADITPELLQGEDWREADYKPYDVTLPAPIPQAGGSHPMQALIERIRSIFLEMGFSEIEGDYVTTAGWNMDSLFIPQDHPAREMQDTFYLENPSEIELSGDRMKQWAEIHESGGDTGSTGWGGEFSEDISQKGMLRTHTTVNTVKHLADNPKEPCRVFAVGRVFRKESIDRTHLPEFHQIEGIIMEPGASLPMLVSTLKEFYTKMGYP